MFDAIIPLRSGSKGIKNKNLIKFKGELLVNFTVKKLLKINDIRRIFILTDSTSYKKKIIKNKKIDLSYNRPKKISRDNSSINEVVLDFLKKKGKECGIEKVLFFHVTTPLVSIKEIKKTINFIKLRKIDSLIHVSEMIEPPYECITKKGLNWKLLTSKYVTNRQNFKKIYFITGSMYYFTRNFFLKSKRVYNNKTYAYEVDKINFIDINTAFDYENAKLLINKKIRN